MYKISQDLLYHGLIRKSHSPYAAPALLVPKMINYAVHDVLAVSFLIQPIIKNWTFEKIKNRRESEMFIALGPVDLSQPPARVKKKKTKKNIDNNKLPRILTSMETSVESISSDDKIFLHQLIEPVNNEHQGEDQVKPEDVMQDVIQTLDDENAELQPEAQDDVLMDAHGQEHVDNHIVVVNEVDQPPTQQQEQHKKKRSEEAGNLEDNHRLNQ